LKNQGLVARDFGGTISNEETCISKFVTIMAGNFGFNSGQMPDVLEEVK
jgi:hypothetical protein